MQFYRPQSFITLLLTGFIFVLLPLLTALFTSVQLLDSLVRQGADAVYQSVDLVHSSRHLSTLLSDEERKVRIFIVLGDLESLGNLNKVHNEIQEVLGRLAEMRTDKQHVLQIEEFSNLEQHLVTVLNHRTVSPEKRLLQKQEQEKLLASYNRLNTLAKSIEKAGNEVMLANIDGLKQSVRRGKKTLFFQTSCLIIFAIFLIILFVVLLSKPVRQIDRAIDRLGEGDFDTRIGVAGPKDLELLGRKLDWLRLRLADLDREKIRLIAHISHELKTPLASIMEGASLLHDELVGPMNVKQKNVVGILNKNSSRLHELIQNILDFNMAQARQKPEAMHPLSLHTLMKKVLTDHENSILTRRIDLRVTLDPVRVTGNRQQIITIFDNLLSNAVKFTPDQGWIIVKVEKKNGIAHCLVADSGPGVEEKERSLIFPPFSQGNQPINTSVKSSGLGLAISSEYAENHGGSLRLLTSTKGACFELILPLMEEDNV
jgi:two-component system sensor histidine kinase GlrK